MIKLHRYLISLSMMFIRFSCIRNFSCFCLNRCLIRSFADISVIETQITFILFDCTSWRSQCWCTLTWRSLVSSFMTFLMRIRIIWRLSHWIFNVSSVSNLIDSKKRLYQIAFFAVREMTSMLKIELSAYSITRCLMHWR